MTFYAHFTLPFIVGAVVMFAIIAWRYVSWIVQLPRDDKRLIAKGLFSVATLCAIWEIIRESLLHVRIWRTNPRLGYMHMSLAFGWFLLIAFGWLETTLYLGLQPVPLQGHVFFRYFATSLGEHIHWIDHVMDLLLLFVLSGVALAWQKRVSAGRFGMRSTTRHTTGDRVALSLLWFVFPARLVAESVTAAIYGGGGFLTGNIGALLHRFVATEVLDFCYEPLWWFYSIVLGGFFVAMPFSRYMHIFTEVPLILLRRYRLRVEPRHKSYDNFEVQSCSRCGICLDPCQLRTDLNHTTVQSVYFLRDRRQNGLTQSVALDCLMCGRCADRCPVGIDLNSLRLNSRATMRNIPNERRYDYLRNIDHSVGEGRVGYFAGCMTMLTPRILSAMERIFEAAGEQVWWADRNGGVCCGRPLKLSGEIDSARKMVEYNRSLFAKHGITTLVTSCPICLRTFREEYDLEGVEVLHHSEYIARLIAEGRLRPTFEQEATYTYHDPCELGRGSGIYEAPRRVIESLGKLIEPTHNGRNALCCGASLANTVIGDSAQLHIAQKMTTELEATGAQTIVTACPLCKKSIARAASKHRRVCDLSEIVAEAVSHQNQNKSNLKQ